MQFYGKRDMLCACAYRNFGWRKGLEFFLLIHMVFFFFFFFFPLSYHLCLLLLLVNPQFVVIPLPSDSDSFLFSGRHFLCWLLKRGG
jgi:hypothetical protein